MGNTVNEGPIRRLVCYACASASALAAAIASIGSLRRYNSALPVRIFGFGIASDSLPPELSALAAQGVTFEACEASPPIPVRWLSMQRLTPDSADQILFADCDTFFFRDVAELFDRHRDLDLYGRERPSLTRGTAAYDPNLLDERALNALRSLSSARSVPPLDTGLLLLSRGVWTQLAGQLDTLRDLLTSEALTAAVPDPRRAAGLKEDVAAWLMLGRAGVRCGLLSRYDALTGLEFSAVKSEPWGCVVAHFAGHRERFLRWLSERPDRHQGDILDVGEASRLAVPRFFQALGDRIEAAFRASGYDEAKFPAIAEAALAALPPSAHLQACDTLAWILTSAGLPRQASVDDPFGQPAVQVYTTQRWYIEVLHWLDGTTAIHQHSFNGAFHVLAGSSIHGCYRFREERRYGARLRTGQLERQHIEMLQAGDVRAIHAGNALIHSLFHLDRPSVTVVVRTTGVPDAGPQFTYAPPHVAFDPFFRTEQLARQLQTCETLGRIEHPDLEPLLCRLYRESDPHSFARLLLQTGSLFKTDEALRFAVAAAGAVHGPLAETLLTVVREQRRLDAIVALRARVRAREPRFLLALLLYFETAQPILDMVRQRFPERDPEAAVLGWITELAALPDPTRPGCRVFDFELKGPGGIAARHMLGGRPLPAVLELLKRDFEPREVDSQAGELGQLQEALRETLLAPLFR